MTQCPVSIRIPRDLTLAGHSNIVECARYTVKCPRCGEDSGLCSQHVEAMCPRCEVAEVAAHNTMQLNFGGEQ